MVNSVEVDPVLHWYRSSGIYSSCEPLCSFPEYKLRSLKVRMMSVPIKVNVLVNLSHSHIWVRHFLLLFYWAHLLQERFGLQLLLLEKVEKMNPLDWLIVDEAERRRQLDSVTLWTQTLHFISTWRKESQHGVVLYLTKEKSSKNNPQPMFHLYNKV